ncbi:MAG: hypothetical protein FJX57_24830 [Alphaproteobacteria bacterium]|nr:hypothetical protein [Alphaproteobacteria bacterium]
MVGAVIVVARGPTTQVASYNLPGTPLQIRLEARPTSLFGSSSFARTLRVSNRERQRQTDLQVDNGGQSRVNLYREPDRLTIVAVGGTASTALQNLDLQVFAAPPRPESPVGYLGAFDLDEHKRIRFFSSAECPWVAIAGTDRPRRCRPG